MKKLFLIATLLFWAGTLFAQINAIVPEKARLEAQVQQQQNEIARLNTILQDTKAERNQLILTIAEMNKNIVEQNAGLEKTRLILQAGINNGGKIDWKTLINDVKWNLSLPDSAATKSDKKPKR